MRTSALRRIGLAMLGFASIAAAAPTLDMLGTLAPGAWEVRYRDGGANGRICVRSGREFIQLRHKGQTCDRVVVKDSAGEVTVQYTCRGAGYGRTNIRKETSGLVQISSQGVAGGKPFQFSAEARRNGACAR